MIGIKLYIKLKYCLEKLMEIDFPGQSIGGLSVGESKEEMYETLEYLKDIMPKECLENKFVNQIYNKITEEVL